MSFVENWYKDNISESDGYYKGRGFGAWVLKPFVDEEKLEREKQRSANEATALNAGIDPAKLGIDGTRSTRQIQGAAITHRNNEATRIRDEDFTRSLQPLSMQLEAQREESNLARDLQREESQLTREQNRDQFTLQYERLLQGDRRAQENFIKELEYQKLRDRKEDRRYNEALDRQERADRRQSIQTLVAGLANLGAAFAL